MVYNFSSVAGVRGRIRRRKEEVLMGRQGKRPFWIRAAKIKGGGRASLLEMRGWERMPVKVQGRKKWDVGGGALSIERARRGFYFPTGELRLRLPGPALILCRDLPFGPAAAPGSPPSSSTIPSPASLYVVYVFQPLYFH